MKKIILAFAILLTGSIYLNAQEASTSNRPAIIQHIEKNSDTVIHQDAKLDGLINDYINRDSEPVSTAYSGPGYRLQVFSSNAQKTAKDQAYAIEQKLRSTFPEYGVYRTYSSPFWKVRIGDFKTHEDAMKFRDELVKIFPELSRETYAVRENKIKIP